MNKIYLLSVIGFIFSGCISLNIKSQLPETDSYVLSVKPDSKTKVCEKTNGNLVALLGYDSLSLYDSKKIIYKDLGDKITFYPHKEWVDSPKIMFKNLLLQKSLTSSTCNIFIAQPPFGTLFPNINIKFNILEFNVNDKSDNPNQKEISFWLAYEIKNSKVLKNGYLYETYPIKNNEDIINGFEIISNKIADELIKKILDFKNAQK